MPQYRIANIERFIANLRQCPNLLAEVSPEWRVLLEKGLALDAHDKTGDPVHEFGGALADLLESVLEHDGEL